MLSDANLRRLKTQASSRAIGPETTDVGRFFDRESLAINSGGPLAAQSIIAKEQRVQAELGCREQVLRALQGVESQATQIIELARALQVRQSMWGRQQLTTQRDQARYDAGTIGVVPLLKSKHRLLHQQPQNLSQQNALQQASISFNKSLGGGWQLFSAE